LMINRLTQMFAHFILLLGVLLMVIPIWLAFTSSTHDNVTLITEGMQWYPGPLFIENYDEV